MRVIAGTARGHTLRTVSSRAVRPTSDRVRETLFNVLAPRIAGARFLDLFAGSGAVGIEALSRGAAHAVLVEKQPTHLRVIAANLERTGLGERAVLVRQDAVRAGVDLAARGHVFDLVFLDPPYGGDWVRRTLEAIGAVPALLAAGGSVIAEHHRRDPVPVRAGSLLRLREVPVGETLLSFYAVDAGAGASQ